MPRNVRGCDQGEDCGCCGYGCRLGAKQSTVKTWLADAHGGGRAHPRRRPRPSACWSRAARRAASRRAPPTATASTVRARAVVAACGAIQTPALLRRSGLDNPNIGKHLRLHPATVVWGVFDEEVRPWEGTMQALYSDEHRYLDGGYGVKYETAADPPEPAGRVRAVAQRARSTREIDGRRCRALGRRSGCCCATATAGEVKVGRDGQPIVDYRLSDYDAATCATGVDGAAQILEAAGAQRIFSSHSRWSRTSPAQRRPRGSSCATPTPAARAPGRCTYGSFHIMGSARMGGSPATSACNPRRRDVGGARPLRLRRLGVPDRIGRQPDDLDRGDRAHERAAARRAAVGVTMAGEPRSGVAAERVAEILAAAEDTAASLRRDAEARAAERIAEADRAAAYRVAAAEEEAAEIVARAREAAAGAAAEARTLGQVEGERVRGRKGPPRRRRCERRPRRTPCGCAPRPTRTPRRRARRRGRARPSS